MCILPLVGNQHATRHNLRPEWQGHKKYITGMDFAEPEVRIADIQSSLMQEKPLQIETIDNGSEITVLRLNGPLLLGNFFPFQTMVRSQTAQLLVIDVTGIPYIDSAGIGCLVSAHVSRQNSGRKLVVVGMHQRLLTSLEVTKVDQLFTFASTVDEARTHAVV
ncbi:MAG: STAS domain-containing protein [Terriglobales bacterium]